MKSLLLFQKLERSEPHLNVTIHGGECDVRPGQVRGIEEQITQRRRCKPLKSHHGKKKCVKLRTFVLHAIPASATVAPTMSRQLIKLSRRERQVMDVLYKEGRATAATVMELMPDPPGYSAVRTLLATLERKGYVRHERDGAKHVFIPMVARSNAARTALAHLIQTFFNGSRGRAAAALLNVDASQFSSEELDELEELVRKARKGGRT